MTRDRRGDSRRLPVLARRSETTASRVSPIQSRLERSVRGDVRFDRLARALYATDASIYEIVPTGVVLPRDVADVVATVRACGEVRVPIVARGAGTGLTGGAVGNGVQVDFSRFMNQILDIDVKRKTARVQPGVVLDDLNLALATHGLHFAPDVATSSRATIGGMIANNSCGAHSVVYGRTVDHVAGVTAVLSDASVVRWGGDGTEGRRDGGTEVGGGRGNEGPRDQGIKGSRGRGIEGALRRILAEYGDDVGAQFPKVMRNNGGYGLDRIVGADGEIDPIGVVCGSEGTLCLVVEATLKLTPLPRRKAMLLAHFGSLHASMSAVSAILEHAPAAVELVDRMILNAATRDASLSEPGNNVEANANAVLVVEMFDDRDNRLTARLSRLKSELESKRVGYGHRIIVEASEQKAVWAMRKLGLGLLMSQPGDVQGYGFVEDTAVDPKRLPEYIDRFGRILKDEGVSEAGYYAHASVGVIHVRPALNLKTAAGVERMRRVADRVSDLALEFGGAMTGEHGDGIVRSCWLSKMVGERLVRAFAEVKEAFDPVGLFNPGKIVDPMPMTEHLRYGADYGSRDVKTHLDFREHGGVAGLAEMCSGVGQCRQRGTGTMCPSFVATGEEVHTTRARANALRIALSDRSTLGGLGDSTLGEVMDLCLMCKACKTECPTGVDLARMKAEWLSHRHLRVGVDRGSRFSADTPKWAKRGSRWPRLSNWVLRSSVARGFLERRYGLDRRVAPPPFAKHAFQHWFARHRPENADTLLDRQTVAFLVDTWTDYFRPEVGVAAVRLLEAAGFQVVLPQVECCGRTLISKGLLGEAALLAKTNVERLARFADMGVPIVGTEPSCVLTLVDEYPQLVQNEDADAVAALAQTVESFLMPQAADRLHFNRLERRILYHGHCHQKAMVGTNAAVALLNLPPGFVATEIDSGCCGMAGSFGHEAEHYGVATAIGEERLLPAVRARGDADIAVSGFSCREQINHHLGVDARHVVEHVADALPESV